jgi:hypothetical protein
MRGFLLTQFMYEVIFLVQGENDFNILIFFFLIITYDIPYVVQSKPTFFN